MNLDEIKARAERAINDEDGAYLLSSLDVPALIAEVERLRGLVLKVEFADFDADYGTFCPWCGSNGRPHVDCSAFTPEGVVR